VRLPFAARRGKRRIGRSLYRGEARPQLKTRQSWSVPSLCSGNRLPESFHAPDAALSSAHIRLLCGLNCELFPIAGSPEPFCSALLGLTNGRQPTARFGLSPQLARLDSHGRLNSDARRLNLGNPLGDDFRQFQNRLIQARKFRDALFDRASIDHQPLT
jgi:hypothetical protein